MTEIRVHVNATRLHTSREQQRQTRESGGKNKTGRGGPSGGRQMMDAILKLQTEQQNKIIATLNTQSQLIQSFYLHERRVGNVSAATVEASACLIKVKPV